MEKRWYVVHTYSGYENKVKTNLEKRVESMGMQDKIFRVLVPTEEEVVNKDGKKKTVHAQSVSGLCARGDDPDRRFLVCRPQHAGRDGICRFDRLGIEADAAHAGRSRSDPEAYGHGRAETEDGIRAEGHRPRQSTGRFTDFIGTVEEILPDKNKLKVHVNMFGRETPLELDYTQVEKI